MRCNHRARRQEVAANGKEADRAAEDEAAAPSTGLGAARRAATHATRRNIGCVRSGTEAPAVDEAAVGGSGASRPRLVRTAHAVRSNRPSCVHSPAGFSLAAHADGMHACHRAIEGGNPGGSPAGLPCDRAAGLDRFKRDDRLGFKLNYTDRAHALKHSRDDRASNRRFCDVYRTSKQEKPGRGRVFPMRSRRLRRRDGS